MNQKGILIYKILKNEDFSTILSLLVRKIFRFEKFIIFEKKLFVNDNLNSIIGTDIVLKKASNYDLAQLQNDNVHYSLENYWNLFYNVDTCFLAYYKGQFAHLSWIYFEHNENNFISLKQREASIGPSYTVNELRGKGIYPYIISKICTYLKGKGIETIYMVVSKNNKSSLKSVRKVGFKRHASMTFVRIFGYKYINYD